MTCRYVERDGVRCTVEFHATGTRAKWCPAHQVVRHRERQRKYMARIRSLRGQQTAVV
jgi:hypothetical protein